MHTNSAAESVAWHAISADAVHVRLAEARTLSNGETRMVPAEEVVLGDIVLLESGDKVLADLRWLT